MGSVSKKSVATAVACAVFISACGGNNHASNPNAPLPPINSLVLCQRGHGAENDASQCIKRGTLIIDSSKDLYYVRSKFSDGRVDAESYYDSNSVTTLATGSYWPEVYSIHGYTLNTATSSFISASLDRYTVQHIFANGMVRGASVYDTNSLTLFDIRTLSAEVESYGNIHRGQLIIDHSNTHYNVEAVYENGEIYASSPYDSNSRSFVKASDLTPQSE